MSMRLSTFLSVEDAYWKQSQSKLPAFRRESTSQRMGRSRRSGCRSNHKATSLYRRVVYAGETCLMHILGEPVGKRLSSSTGRRRSACIPASLTDRGNRCHLLFYEQTAPLLQVVIGSSNKAAGVSHTL